MAQPLSLTLRTVSLLLRQYSDLGIDLPADACLRLGFLLARAARQADELEAQAQLADEIEDELLAVASDLDRVIPAGGPSFQAALKAQQMEIQQRLDRGGPVHVSRPGLAALAAPIGDTNVVSFPVAPHPLLSGTRLGGDVA